LTVTCRSVECRCIILVAQCVSSKLKEVVHFLASKLINIFTILRCLLCLNRFIVICCCFVVKCVVFNMYYRQVFKECFVLIKCIEVDVCCMPGCCFPCSLLCWLLRISGKQVICKSNNLWIVMLISALFLFLPWAFVDATISWVDAVQI